MNFGDDGTALYPNDAIKNVPYDVINRVATEGGSWDRVKNLLREYILQGYYTEAQLGYLFADWDEFFARNPS